VAGSVLAGLAGLLIVPAVIGAPVPAPGPSRWCIGAVALGWTVAALHAVGAPQPIAIGGALAALMVIGLWSLLDERHIGARGVRIGLPTSLLLLILGVPLIFTTLGTAVSAWDPVAIWYAKTKGLFAWQQVAALSIPNYPNLGPAAWMLLLRIVGPEAEPVARLVFPALYLAWIAGLSESVSRSHPWLAGIAVGLGALAFLDVRAITSGHQEIALTAVAGTAVLFFLRDLEADPTEAARRPELIGAALAGSLGMIKVEGGVLGVIIFLSWAVTRSRQRLPSGNRRILAAAGLLVPIIAVWPVLSFLAGVDPTAVHRGLHPASLLAVPSRLERWYPILIAMLPEAPPRRFGLLAGIMLSVATTWLIPAARRTVGFLWGILGLHYLFVVLVFFAVDYAFAWYLATACRRLMSLADFVPITLLAVCAMRLADIAAAGRVVRNWIQD
jgi:hypothetical protein